MSKSSTNIVCRSKKVVHNLRDISNVQIVRKGKETATRNTIRYKIVLTFASGRPIGIMETGDLSQARVYVSELGVRIAE
ncbi:MAG: hypothetical protein P4M11_08960 [Candidatus Pacebacteria bacterium]|nr:hypothetical protein [Candidatus Paceibacterota bacterium]